ncbi:MAG: hypothetical protein J6Z43_01870 [Clostridiales bacterium]|nr:hypothetical protein [Clostridiales bacterium]
MSKTVSTCICETNLIANQPQENVFFLTLSRKKSDFPNEFLRTARSTSPIQICAVFSCIGPDNAGAMLNLELNNELERLVANVSNSPVLDFEAFSNQVINVLNVKVCNVSASIGIPLKVSMTMVVIEGDVLRVIHVGNTKATLLRDNRLMVLTEEQTVAHRYVQMGAITPEQELTHPDNMNLTQYLGKMPQDGPVVPFKKVQLKLKDNDEIFIMGLGISHLMPAQMRNLILVRPINSESKARELMNSAMNYGIKSGLTAICMKVESTFLLPGDAVIGSHLASDGTVAKAQAAQAAAGRDNYTPFGEPNRPAAAAKSSDTIPFNPNNADDQDYDDEDDDGDEYYDENYSADRKAKNQKILAIAIPIIIFIVSVALGFGIMYLIFNFKDIVNKTSETSASSASNLVYYVTADGTPVFAQEDINSTMVASLNRGDAVTVNSAGSLFSNVTTSANVTGFILNEMITLEDPTSGETTSIIDTNETPAPSTVATSSSDTSESTTESTTIQTTAMTPQTQATRANTPTPTPAPTATPTPTPEPEPDEPDHDETEPSQDTQPSQETPAPQDDEVQN